MAVLHVESLVIGDSKEVIGNEDRDTIDIWRQKRICICCIFWFAQVRFVAKHVGIPSKDLCIMISVSTIPTC